MKTFLGNRHETRRVYRKKKKEEISFKTRGIGSSFTRFAQPEDAVNVTSVICFRGR